MLYNIKAHIPDLVNKMITEDFRAGDTVKLDRDKIMIVKLFDNQNDFNNKIRFIDEEYNKRKEMLTVAIEDLQRKLEQKVKEIDNNEKNYWETIVGEIIRTNKTIPSPPVDVIDE